MAESDGNNRYRSSGKSGNPRSRSKGFHLVDLFGIGIFIDPSWIFIFFLITWGLASGFAKAHSDWSAPVRLATAVSAALLFFASVLIHELSHSLVARSRGLPVHSITLFLFGGVSNLEREPASAKTEFVMAIVGPLSSFLLGILFLALGRADARAILTTDPIGAFTRLGPLPTILLWLGSVNILLGLFNLVPGFPLDGGRVLRSLLWATTNDLQKATRWAASAGKAIGLAFILTGIAMAFGYRLPVFGTGVFNGLWLAFIGWFLKNAADASYRQVVIDDLLVDVPVGRLMRKEFPTVAADMLVGKLVDEHILGTDEGAFPVVDGGRLSGMVCLGDVRKVPRGRWESTPVREIMTPASEVSVAASTEGVSEALREMTRREVRQLPVVDAGKVVGLLRRRDIVKWLHLQSA
ncbi:MAG: site-2 protease family protein [Thermoanaerobaculia bacterium]